MCNKMKALFLLKTVKIFTFLAIFVVFIFLSGNKVVTGGLNSCGVYLSEDINIDISVDMIDRWFISENHIIQNNTAEIVEMLIGDYSIDMKKFLKSTGIKKVLVHTAS